MRSIILFLIILFMVIMYSQANLQKAVNMALKKLQQSGEYMTILNRYGFTDMNVGVTSCEAYDSASWPKVDGVLKEVLYSWKTILFCHEPVAYPPYLDTPETGFEMDIAAAITQELRKKYNVPSLTHTWTFIEPEEGIDFFSAVKVKIEGGQCDIALSAIQVTDARKLEVDFTCPYLARQKVLIRSNMDPEISVTTNNQANSAKISGITYEANRDYVQKNIPKADFVYTNDTELIYTSLVFDLVHIVLDDSDWANYLIKQAVPDKCADKCKFYTSEPLKKYLSMVVRTKPLQGDIPTPNSSTTTLANFQILFAAMMLLLLMFV